MNISKLITTIFTLSIIQILSISIADARPRTYPFIIKSTGTFISTPLDTDADGLPASISMLEGRSKRFGRVTAKIVTEAKLTLDSNGNPVTCETPDGNSGVINEVIKAIGIYNFRDGSQVFTEATTGSTCADVEACFDRQGGVKEGCVFFGLAEAKITGGTGRFACVSGDIEDDNNGLALVVDAKNQFFGSILESNVNGTITIDRNCNK